MRRRPILLATSCWIYSSRYSPSPRVPISSIASQAVCSSSSYSSLPSHRTWLMSGAGESSSAGGAGGSHRRKALVVDPFCYRQFANEESSLGYGGTILDVSIQDFEDVVNARYDERLLQPGYAPFCKHLFVVNDFTEARVNILPITPDNEARLRTKYEARNDRELPVLTRYFPKELVGGNDNLPVAKYLDLILYSREQINLENAAQGNKAASDSSSTEAAPWGIVSIKAQDVDRELPMTPITAMRNALGKEEGGSGVPLDRDEYLKAVAYWKDHATVS